MRNRLEVGVDEFKNLCSRGIEFVEACCQVAQNALQHILWWGVCLPTTCCYQYIGLQPKIKVYQYFMCPGLGTTYRIQNYWVHLFLAGLFSHCTSMPIYIVNGRAYFGKCPKVVMFSWGGDISVFHVIGVVSSKFMGADLCSCVSILFVAITHLEEET